MAIPVTKAVSPPNNNYSRTILLRICQFLPIPANVEYLVLKGTIPGFKATSSAQLVEETGFRFSVDKFRELVTDKTKLVILNSPHNPTGLPPPRQIFCLWFQCAIYAAFCTPFSACLCFDSSAFFDIRRVHCRTHSSQPTQWSGLWRAQWNTNAKFQGWRKNPGSTKTLQIFPL